MIILSDNDVRGAVRALRRAIEHEWTDAVVALDLRFMELEDLGLREDSTDNEVYTKCLEVEAILVTADRTARDGRESLENVIGRLGRDDSYPVITIGDPERLVQDRDYGSKCAEDLIDYLLRIDYLRRTRRLFLPFSPQGLGR
jgi:SMC interacting uncharacterized protein involved in chromosome segregation